MKRITRRALRMTNNPDSSEPEQKETLIKKVSKKKKSKSRTESSLSVLTIKFLKLLHESDTHTVNLNKAVEVLKV